MTWRMQAVVLGVAGVFALGAVACQEEETPRSEKVQPAGAEATQAAGQQAGEPSGELPEGHPPVAGQGAAGAGAGQIQGEVLETMDASGYTYAKLETAKGEVWVAVRQMPLEVGEQLTVSGANLMKGFKSKTLDRTFDEIYFAMEGHTGAARAAAAPKAAAEPGSGVEPVAKAEGENAYTVAELFEKKAELAGKSVAVRGKVVKFNAGIMGKNWVHLRDGTGAAGTNDITVTTQASAKEGDVVTMTGTLVTDKDFGAGYKYDVLVEEGQLKR